MHTHTLLPRNAVVVVADSLSTTQIDLQISVSAIDPSVRSHPSFDHF
jgi:hypothetical protein